MSKARIYNSPLIKELLDGITPDQFDLTEKRMLLAARLDDAIRAKGWKKYEFAKAIGKKPSVISKWLSGTHNFTADTLFEIERVLNISFIRIEHTPEITVKTYIYSVSSTTGICQPKDWLSMFIDKPAKSSFKAKGQFQIVN